MGMLNILRDVYVKFKEYLDKKNIKSIMAEKDIFFKVLSIMNNVLVGYIH